MINNILKILFLIVAVFATYLLFKISEGFEKGRYTMAINQEGYTRILDTKTGELFYVDEDGNYNQVKNGKFIIIKVLPK
ncbi:hypothetical protein GS399_00620 [Pedobacter sp. HMF7647]|uniref:Uncharacterized protein n=1 Tax=Hufsiella arboris TaxID=2695275 RepID=A0A7K1Y608_9SPHI|nr:hypothetical protein [Hufsiella arboris]MXV49458.1 hypothetical protein [Hufsiella arboris]